MIPNYRAKSTLYPVTCYAPINRYQFHRQRRNYVVIRWLTELSSRTWRHYELASRFSKSLRSAFRSNRSRRIGRYLSELILAVAPVGLAWGSIEGTRRRVSVLDEGKKTFLDTLVGSNLTGIKVIEFHIGWTFSGTRGSRFGWPYGRPSSLISHDCRRRFLAAVAAVPSTWPHV